MDHSSRVLRNLRHSWDLLPVRVMDWRNRPLTSVPSRLRPRHRVKVAGTGGERKTLQMSVVPGETLRFVYGGRTRKGPWVGTGHLFIRKRRPRTRWYTDVHRLVTSRAPVCVTPHQG